MTEYDRWMLLLEYLGSDNHDMFEDELAELIDGRENTESNQSKEERQ